MQIRLIVAALVGAAFLGTADGAPAQSFPARPVALIVPYAAGGPTDTIARILAQHMRRHFAKPSSSKITAPPEAA